MKLWDKGYTTDNVVDKFTVGQDRILDLKLVKHDVRGNIAHAKMLNSIQIITDSELVDILSKLNLGEEIPDVLYKVIAEIIAFAYHLQGKKPEGFY